MPTHPARLWLLGCLLWLYSLTALAAGDVLRIATRPGVQHSLLWWPAPAARATVLLFPGGNGGFGRVTDGVPDGDNFLVRAAPLLVAQGLNVAIFGRPDDGSGLGYEARIDAPHLADIGAVLAEVRRRAGQAPWLIGTSRGTLSATAAAIALQPQVAGLILSSSVVGRNKAGAVPTQDLAAIRLPVLLIHHRRDACPVCRPADVPALLAQFSQASDKQLQWLDGGGPPHGKACGAWHWHGYNGIEAEAVAAMAGWIRARPAPAP